jgi:hypothetical protein
MTRGRGNTEILRQMWHSSKVLVVWGAGVGALAICETKRKTSDDLEG